MALRAGRAGSHHRPGVNPSLAGTEGPGLRRALLWRSLLGQGLEYCSLWRRRAVGADPQGGWALRGTAIAEFDGGPAEVRYRVITDDRWQTRRVHVGVVHGDRKRALRLEADGTGRWWSGAAQMLQFSGLVDVDLGIGASTNTLPIRRLGLSVGESAELVAAWVRFPDLRVERLPQRYTRLSDRRYLYESLDSDFKAEFEVDDLGLVVRYEGWCERIAVFDPPRPEATGSG